MLLTLLLDPPPGIGGLVDALGRLLLLIVLLGLLLYFWLRYRAVERHRATLRAPRTAQEALAYSERRKKRLRLLVVMALVLMVIIMYQG
jgi:hypothetical protein